MNALEVWIERCLAIPDAELGRWDKGKEERRTTATYELFEEVPPEGLYSVEGFRLFNLLAHIEEKPCEAGVWHVVVLQTSHPLPDAITHDLIDRSVALVELAHRPQNEAILRRLSPLVAEARLTLIGKLYRSPERTVEEFTELLDQYPEDDWLWGHLSHSIASSPEKLSAFLKRVEGRPEWQFAQDRQKDHEADQLTREQHQENVRRARQSFDESELRVIYSSAWREEDCEILSALVQNSATPADLLESISRARNFSGAPQLRNAAKNALYRRRI